MSNNFPGAYCKVKGDQLKAMTMISRQQPRMGYIEFTVNCHMPYMRAHTHQIKMINMLMTTGCI